MLLDKLEKKGLITPPPFVISNTCYMTIMGSHAYGVADTSVKSKVPDYDVYGFCVPNKDIIFPHLRGEIAGFGTPGQRFEQYQKHHIMDKDGLGGKGQEWDLQIFNIVKYFELCRENNPNMIDSLFTPENCVIHCTQIGQMVRDKRKLFLSKEAWKKFRGYAWSQMHKMESKETVGEAEELRQFEDEMGVPHTTRLADVERMRENYDTEAALGRMPMTKIDLEMYYERFKECCDKSTRFEMVKVNGYDVKFAYHVLRLLDEAEQILLTGDIDLQRAREPMKAVRRGEWTAKDIREWAMQKEKSLEAAYVNCPLPEKAPEDKLRKLLLECLEEHYGSLSEAIPQPDWAMDGLREIDGLLNKYRTKMYQGKIQHRWWQKVLKRWFG